MYKKARDSYCRGLERPSLHLQIAKCAGFYSGSFSV
ncbi:hypothetical protein RDSD_001879 [Oleidesulfovibrio alaskensis]